MRYGIIEEGQDVLCANCNDIISEDGTISSNYCPNCGCPLTMEAIRETEQRNMEIEKNVLHTLKSVSKEENTDSFIQILKAYTDED